MERNLKVWFTTPEKKIRPKSHLTWGKKEDYHIFVAKCAAEGCQVSFKAPEARENMKIEILGERGGFEIELLREYYADCDGAKWPDPVVPDCGEFSLEPECNVTYLINVVTDENSVAGEYALTVRLTENGEIYGEYPLTVTVWNFVLDRSEPMHTGAEIARNFMLRRDPTDDPEGLYKKYYDFMLKRYHFCAYELPYDILDPRADEYLDNPEVTVCYIPLSTDDETLKKYHEKLSKKPEWFKKTFFNIEDEPCNMEAYERIKAAHKRLERVFPGYLAVSPFFKDPDGGNGVRAHELLKDITRVWCPKSVLYKDKDFCDFMAARDEEGDRVWWYVCWEPGLPYANLFVDMEGFYHRVLFWQQYLYRVRGILYWTTTWWRDCDPWDSVSTVRDLSYYCFGDGHLLYPGSRIGHDGPIGSLRFELVRYGIEDYHMLRMAEKEFGREWVDELVKSVTPNIREYNDDHDALDRVRIVIGEKLSNQSK